MPVTSSATKALRVSKKKKIFNTRRKNTQESAVKSLKKLIRENKVKEAEKLLPEVYQAIDKAVKTKFLKKNTGARTKSRITIFLNKAKKVVKK